MSGCRADVLIPTCDRACALAVTLTALHAQRFRYFRIIISDQSEQQSSFDQPEVKALLRILRVGGRDVQTHRHLPRRGLAEQRAFLLSRASAPYCLFLDDDVVLEPDLIERLHQTICAQQCGFLSRSGSRLPRQAMAGRIPARPAWPGGRGCARAALSRLLPALPADVFSRMPEPVLPITGRSRNTR